jgi:ABC-2 type transport system permease protein
MAAWRSFFEDPIPWQQIKESVGILVAHNVLFIGVSVLTFHRKDITV